jgi:hypothetical protein
LQQEGNKRVHGQIDEFKREIDGFKREMDEFTGFLLSLKQLVHGGEARNASSLLC